MATSSDIADNAAAPARPRRLVLVHWLTVLCLLGAATAILTRDEVSARLARQWLLEIHRHFGLFVLALFFIRVVVRARIGALPSPGNTSLATRAAAGVVHFALYALLLIQPLLGWALSNAQDKPVHLFGLTLPALVAADEDRADTLQTWHTNVAWLLLALIVLHVLAALWHHFVRRDGVLRAMWWQRQRHD
ncbi:cytochrome b [Dyella nitratireducens]|uniref:Cytochrome like B561 n=1 Tax=Dyella nitratireducens TaxID=1849580 RepID=A0ABQ1G8H2_9GAMM|nr:cytochrome b [Dyella nitratireducens]GGA38789.1 cytochrome like B561 [Dyella nitratireducens]GLQ40363.1 cytochrome like B561 [Dyella nitratireducens]